MSGLADLASIVTSGAACIALVFAGVQLKLSRAQDRHNRQVEINGVAVSWRAPTVPRTAENDEGWASWVYEFTAHNPGQLAITDVWVEVHFDLDVQRIRHDGHIDDATRTLFMQTPVIAGRHERTWRRSLRMNYADAHAALPGTTATISFIDPEDKPRKNIWPKHLPKSNGQGAYSSASQQIPPANT